MGLGDQGFAVGDAVDLIGEEFVQFAGFEAAEADGIPETAGDLTAQLVAPLRREGHPAFG